MSKAYTLEELLIITVAKEIRDYENVVLGVGLPTTAGALAKAIYAPHATLIMESGIFDFEPLLPLNHIADANALRGFAYATDLFSAFTMTYRGFVDVCFLGVAQIDKFGNLNTTVIGDYDKPTMRLPGSGGAADFLSYAKRTVLTMLGGEFVNKLDYVTSPGYLEGGDSREKTGRYPKGSGPSMLLTTKGVFRFDPVSKELYLAQIHPRVRIEDVKKDVPWDLKISPNVSETDHPTEEEIDFVRRFAPAQAAGRKLMTELVVTNIMKKMAQKAKA
ncbi:MAG: glutaconate CoA-transferase [Deltaproteobacteria bacterium HGW-Deltaproteobacteria-6]|jgi:glutaconate CoA-transferase subunit B|nr:MAG: glutaconate CoA-transferase [Deltaproteobacteria bacterium HGW-Deltaproteobacteria-6]